jgi:H+/Cl- antiporter ClcA
MMREFEISTIVKGMFVGCIIGMVIYALFGEYLYEHVYWLYTHPGISRYWYFHMVLTGCLISAFCSFLGALVARDFAQK